MAETTYLTHPSYLEAQRLARRACNPPVRGVIAHWMEMHDRESLPDRRDFDPIDLPARLLPYLFLVERVPARGTWRLRLVGSHIVEAQGGDYTGAELVDEQMPGISRSRTVRLLGTVSNTGLPAHFHGRSEFRLREDYNDHEQVLLPFRHLDSGTVEFVLGALVFEGLPEVYGPGSRW